MSNLINQLQDTLTPETPLSDATELIPFTDLTGQTKYTIGTGSQRTVLYTDDPAHNTFAYLYATNTGDTILLKRLVLPVIQKQTNKTTPVIDGAITTDEDVTLQDTDNNSVPITLTTPDENIINKKPFTPESPVHENCKLISKSISEGIQSFNVTVPISSHNEENHVVIHNIPIHVETRIIRRPSTPGVITNTDTETQPSTTEIANDTLPLHALDEDTQVDVFQFVLDAFDDLDMQTQQSVIEMLPYVSDGIIEEHTTQITQLLYRTPSMYAREIGDVIPVTAETIDEIIDIITPRLNEFIEATDTYPAPILSTVTAISKTIHESTETTSQHNEFLKTVAYPIVQKEINTLSQAITTQTEDVTDIQEQWVAGDGFTHRVNAVLPWLLGSTVTINEDFLRGVLHLSSTDEQISDSFIIELLCGDYNNVITDTVRQSAVTTTSAVVERVVIKYLRGEKTTTDTVSESRARTAAEIFEKITDQEVIRREPPTGYTSTTTNTVDAKKQPKDKDEDEDEDKGKEEDPTVTSDTETEVTDEEITEESSTDSTGTDTGGTDGDEVHEHSNNSDTTPSDVTGEKNDGGVTDEDISEDPIDEKEDSNGMSAANTESPSETSAEFDSNSTETTTNTESKSEEVKDSPPAETTETNTDTNEDEHEDEDQDEYENETVNKSEGVAEESEDEVNENDDGDDDSDADSEGTESDSESTNNSVSLTDF